MDSKENLIELRKINLTYNRGKNNAFQALFDVNIDIKEGEFVVILGPSGCGKSSLLNIIAGLEDPDSGTVFIDGVDILKMKTSERTNFHRSKIGMIFQAYNLISNLSVLDNVALPQIFVNQGKKEREKKVMSILEKLGIKEHSGKIPSQLSGGQQQRIGIARSIVNNPSLILADEPVGNLDSRSANNVMQIISDLNRVEGRTILMVSHNVEIVNWASHVIHMKDGRVIKEEWKDPQGFSKEVQSSLEESKSYFDKLMDKFRGLTEEQIRHLLQPLKANVIAESILVPYEEKQLRIIKESTKLVLSQTYDINKFFETLDKPLEESGAGLDERIAKKFSLELSRLMNIAEKVFGNYSSAEKSRAIVEHLTKNKEIDIQVEKIDKAVGLIEKRLKKEISHDDLKEKLDLPERLGGIGLDRRAVMKVLREIDLIMIVGLGIK